MAVDRVVKRPTHTSSYVLQQRYIPLALLLLNAAAADAFDWPARKRTWMTAYIANTSALYTGTLREAIRLAHGHLSGGSLHVARNVAYAAAGVYLWEAVQYAMYDVQFIYAFAARLWLFLQSFCGLQAQQDETKPVKENLGSTPAFSPMSPETAPPIPQMPSRLNSNMLPSLFALLNTLAQFTYLFLRLSTSLALLALLASFNPRGSKLSLCIYGGTYVAPPMDATAECAIGKVREGDAYCSVWRAIRLISSVTPLLSFAFSNLFLFLRVISIWSGCRKDELPPSPGRSISESQLRSVQQERQSKIPVHHKLRLYHYGRSRALLLLCLLLHIVQYVVIVLIGLIESGSGIGVGGDLRGRKLVLGAFVYFAFLDVLALVFIVVGIIRCRGVRADLIGIDSSDVGGSGCDREHQYSVVSPRSCVCMSRNAHTSDHAYCCACMSLSEMSFAPKSDSCTCEGDEHDAESSVEGDVAMRVCAHRTGSGLRIEERRWLETVSGVGENDADHGAKAVVWVHICTEGGRQGFLWATPVVLMKVGVLVCVLFDASPDGRPTALNFQQMCFFTPALVIIAIASGRLFLQITQASPVGDGYMEAVPPPPLSPSTSLFDITVPPAAHDQNRRSHSRQAKLTTYSHVDALPSYIDRAVYTRRVRHEMEAAAGGAVRTVGGSVVLPAPVPASARPRSGKSKQQRDGGERALQRLVAENGETGAWRRMQGRVEIVAMRRVGKWRASSQCVDASAGDRS